METMARQKLIEQLSEEVHNAWWEEKTRQGFHPPINHHGTDFKKFIKVCDNCHTDMYPYSELPENIKDYDRVMVKTVLDALNNLGCSVIGW